MFTSSGASVQNVIPKIEQCLKIELTVDTRSRSHTCRWDPVPVSPIFTLANRNNRLSMANQF